MINVSVPPPLTKYKQGHHKKDSESWRAEERRDNFQKTATSQAEMYNRDYEEQNVHTV